MSIRTEKVASVIKRALVNPVQNLAKEFNAGLASVTSVKLSADLSIAKVYISVYSGKITPLNFISILEENKRELRHILAQNVQLKSIPNLKFFHDDTLDQMEHIQQLIDLAKKSYTNSEPTDNDSK